MSHRADSIIDQINGLDIFDREDLFNQLTGNPEYELTTT